MATGKRIWIKAKDGTKITAHKTWALKDEGEKNYAWYDPVTGNIDVASNNIGVMERKLFHELIHKACDGMTNNDQLAIFGEDATEDTIEVQEEALCCWAEGKLFDLLTRNGWLKFPKPPRFQ